MHWVSYSLTSAKNVITARIPKLLLKKPSLGEGNRLLTKPALLKGQ